MNGSRHDKEFVTEADFFRVSTISELIENHITLIARGPKIVSVAMTRFRHARVTVGNPDQLFGYIDDLLLHIMLREDCNYVFLGGTCGRGLARITTEVVIAFCNFFLFKNTLQYV
jgi:hypothetical protein